MQSVAICWDSYIEISAVCHNVSLSHRVLIGSHWVLIFIHDTNRFKVSSWYIMLQYATIWYMKFRNGHQTIPDYTRLVIIFFGKSLNLSVRAEPVKTYQMLSEHVRTLEWDLFLAPPKVDDLLPVYDTRRCPPQLALLKSLVDSQARKV